MRCLRVNFARDLGQQVEKRREEILGGWTASVALLCSQICEKILQNVKSHGTSFFTFERALVQVINYMVPSLRRERMCK